MSTQLIQEIPPDRPSNPRYRGQRMVIPMPHLLFLKFLPFMMLSSDTRSGVIENKANSSGLPLKVEDLRCLAPPIHRSPCVHPWSLA